MFKQRKGYSYLEIITVVAIIGILTTVGLVNFNQGENLSALQLQAQQLINVFRDLQIKAINSVTYQNQPPLGGYGWMVNDYSNGVSQGYSLFIRTQNVSGPYDPVTDVVISSTTMPTNFSLLPPGLVTLNFKPLTGSVDAYLSNGQSLSSSSIGVKYSKVDDYWVNILINNSSGIITSQLSQ